MRKWYSMEARGVLSLSGEMWVEVAERDKVGYLPYEDCTNQSFVRQRLGRQGIVIASSGKAAHLATQLDDIDKFSPASLIGHVGWNEGYFALPDGTVFSPKGADAPVVVFATDQSKCRAAGTTKRWRKRVARPITGQPIPMFAVMLAFMPPLLRLSSRTDNFGFDIVGPPGTGKSTIQLLAASAIGPIGRGHDGANYTLTFNATLNALEEQLATHSDLPMFIEDASLFLADEPAAKRGAAYKAFAFRIGGGKVKDRLGIPAERVNRLGFFSSSNESLIALLGEATDTASAAASRLTTFQLGNEHRYGVFESIPQGYGSASAFARALIEAAAANHGLAMRRFLKRLVQARADDEAALKRQIARLVAKFIAKAGVDQDDGSQMRVAEACGLVYAAGVLAQKYRVVPKSWRCGPAVLACYEKYRVAPTPPVTFKAMLDTLASAPTTVHLGNDRKISSKTLDAAEVVVREHRGSREVLVLAKVVQKQLPGWSELRKRPDVKALLRRESGHDTVKVKLHKNLKQRRYYVFVCSAGSEAGP